MKAMLRRIVALEWGFQKGSGYALYAPIVSDFENPAFIV